MPARDKRAAAQLLAQTRFKKGEAPAPVVDAALKSFSAPPSPEQIAAVSMQLARTQGVAAAIEFETYAKGLVIDQARAKADQAYQGGQAPQQATQQALNSYGTQPPSEEQIRAKSAELSRKSPALAAEFEAYARGLVADRAARQEGQYSERDVRTLENDFDSRANTRLQGPPPAPYGGGEPAPAPLPAPAPQASPPPVPVPAPAPPVRQGQTAAPPEESMLEQVKEKLRQVLPMKGYRRLKGMVGLGDGGPEKPRASR